MIQKILGNIYNLLFIGILLYILLISIKIIRYPNLKWKFQIEKIKGSKYGWLFNMGIIIAIISILINIRF